MNLGRRKHSDEHGQAMVEFALVLPILLLVIIGIFEFGKAINYWIDQNQLASEGARWVVVNKVPGGPTPPASVADYKTYILTQAETQELRNLATNGIKICFASGTTAGNPATVAITSNYSPLPLLKIATVRIVSKATMRLEQAQSYGGGDPIAQC